jgi:hypothetical protein
VATSDSPTSTVYGGTADKFCHRLQTVDEEDMIEGWANESSDQGETRGEPHPRYIRARAAQGGVTLGPEQGEAG